ncbi:MAG: hypothetical protein JXQ29_01375, partial [Planctomycetes bacterium]|nr:hypothetical protein [Planctomycetota bacterium]
MIVRGAGFLLLVALAAHVVPRAPAQEADRLDDAAVRQAVERVMSSADFCHLLPRARAEGKGPFERFLEWMFGAPEEEGEESGVRISIGAGFGPLLGWILYLVAGTAIALVLAFMIRALAAKRESRPATAPGGGGAATALTATAPPGEQPAGAYLGRALACACAGDYRTAIAQLLLGGMSWLERAGAIRFRKGL